MRKYGRHLHTHNGAYVVRYEDCVCWRSPGYYSFAPRALPDHDSDVDERDGPDVLVIEDERTFRFSCVYARTMGEAWQLLFSQPWREVWWDFDMGKMRNSVNTYPLAKRVEEMAFNGEMLPVERMVVHSQNPPGGDNLMLALRAYDPIRVDANDYLVDA